VSGQPHAPDAFPPRKRSPLLIRNGVTSAPQPIWTTRRRKFVTFPGNYIPDSWKTAEVSMIRKPGKNLSQVESFRPISLLPIMSNFFEKLILKRLKPIIAERHLVPTHQFCFRKNHSTIDEVHRITDIIEITLENKGVCSALSRHCTSFRQSMA
jgi:hypothetical protein